MIRYEGTRISDGIAIAPLVIIREKDERASHDAPFGEAVETAARERLFFEARQRALSELDALYQKTLAETDEETAAIFTFHQSVLLDEDFEEAVLAHIRDGMLPVPDAVRRAGGALSASFLAMENPYLQARAQDIDDLTLRLVRCLKNEAEVVPDTGESEVILALNALSPGTLMQMDLAHVRGIVVSALSTLSHTAILARAKGLPVISGVTPDECTADKPCVLNASCGILHADADETLIAHYRQKKALQEKETAQSPQTAGPVRVGQCTITLSANVSSVTEAMEALASGADGIGLFRSEALYFSKDTLPSEDMQYRIYRDTLDCMQGKRVVIRTADFGADKMIPALPFPQTDNPALGLRGVRYALLHPALLKTQLRALLRASVFGDLHILYPMISSMDEVLRLKAMFAEVKEELLKEGLPVSDSVTQGVMIETPAAVFISEELAKEVRFFSVGLNDLTQYLLASDRNETAPGSCYDWHHPAVLRAVRMAAASARKYGLRLSVCGEAAQDETMTGFFLSAGVDELSMTPKRIPALRNTLLTLAGEAPRTTEAAP